MSQDGPAPDPATRTEGEGETLDMPEGMGAFSKGQVLGERYQILKMLGRGGMGEVWHAFDLKLRVDVGLKALRGDLFKSERRLELLRQEVRAAREVVSPNVCRIFDLIEVEGRELVSMEYVDGATLLGVLQERGPLELKEAQDIASQFLAGLEAIHRAGLIHRDIKPENIMLTRAGRVVVMDFGLARQEEEGGGSVSGTPAYMSPEQAAGETLDARADVYASGVVLAEMVSPDGIKSYESRQSIWEGVRSEPAKLPDSPWAPVIKRALAKERAGRYNTAHTLTRALEDVTLRTEGAEDLHPYPGLASFKEEDAEYFFGREAEVEQMWRKLEGPPRLLGLVGPSGAGKSSFIRAGLFATSPAGWSFVVCTPGNAATTSLGRTMAREMAGDADVVEKMMDFDDPDVAVEVLSRWSQRTDRALLVVDQFEELFTQNGADEQRSFSELLSQIVLTSNVHVLLSMRDDFLLWCHDHEALAPLFSDLTPLRAPAGAALRRALVQPATKCGYRFEDDELVEEMLAEVEGERGALPMLAFAAARLWEMRDREAGLLTRQAYEDVGGVGGALARHAEATIDRIGTERIAVVRELFRNLVTAEGTRAVREWNELLSVFDTAEISRAGIKPAPTKKEATVGAGFIPAREAAEEVLRELIDARLLTSYEVREEDREPTRRVEIIHESLLANWPRLVRWQTQDVEGAQLRDELRQAARSWDEHDRHDDRLWTGTAFREFQLWRERYPGGLTEIEEEFARAMTSLATRRRRRQRIAMTVGAAVLAVVLTVVTALWRQSVLQTRRAEASKLLALGEVEIDAYPTAALAWATASLELADTLEGRQFALRALSKGPPVTVMPPPLDSDLIGPSVFSPNGEWLASLNNLGWGDIWLSFQDGLQPAVVGDTNTDGPVFFTFASDDVLITTRAGVHRWWSVQDPAEPQRTDDNRDVFRAAWGDGDWHKKRSDDGFFWYTEGDGKEWIHRWRFDDKTPLLVGGMEPWWWDSDTIDSTGSWLAYSPTANRGREVYLRSLVDWSRRPRRLGRHDQKVLLSAIRPDGRQVASLDELGDIRIWPTDGGSAKPVSSPKLAGDIVDMGYGPDGRWLASHGQNEDGHNNIWLLDLAAPWGAAPLELRRSDNGIPNPDQMAFHPSADWLFASTLQTSGFWPLTHPYPWIFDHGGRVMDVAFTPDGKWLLSLSSEGEGRSNGQLRAWPLDGQNGGTYRVLLEQPWICFVWANLAVDPAGEHVAVGSQTRRAFVVPIAGGPARVLTPGWEIPYRVAFSPDGKLLATVPRPFRGDSSEKVVQVWDLETGESREIGSVRGKPSSLRFVDQRHLLWSGGTQDAEKHEEKTFDLVTGEVKTRSLEGRDESRIVSSSGSQMVAVHKAGAPGSGDGNHLVRTDLTTGRTERISSHGENPLAVALDPSEQWIVTAGNDDGIVRVGPISGEEPHLLYGHEGQIHAVAVSPDGRWIASAGNDRTVRVWPMPDLSKPPLHTLPHDEFLAKLKTLTNLRAVRDEESPTGWKVEIGPFPGWETVPEW